MRSFVMSALRRAQWPVKYEAISKAFVKVGPNPATGRMCKLHRCEQCQNLFPKGEMAADHIEPVIPIDGWEKKGFLGYNWDSLIQRLYCEIDGFQALCGACHKLKTKDEVARRAALRRSKDYDGI
jgi:hypothetical protein